MHLSACMQSSQGACVGCTAFFFPSLDSSPEPASQRGRAGHTCKQHMQQSAPSRPTFGTCTMLWRRSVGLLWLWPTLAALRAASKGPANKSCTPYKLYFCCRVARPCLAALTHSWFYMQGMIRAPPWLLAPLSNSAGNHAPQPHAFLLHQKPTVGGEQPGMVRGALLYLTLGKTGPLACIITCTGSIFAEPVTPHPHMWLRAWWGPPIEPHAWLLLLGKTTL